MLFRSNNFSKYLEVDNLKPSKYLEKLLEENVSGNLTIKQVEEELREYYIEKENKNEISIGEITISKTKDNTTSNEDISRQDKQEIKEYLAKTYDISEKIIDIN